MENKESVSLQRRYGTRSTNILGELSSNIYNNNAYLTSSLTKDEGNKKRRRSIRGNDNENNNSLLTGGPCSSTEKTTSKKTTISSNENLSDNSCQGIRKTRSRTSKPNPNESLHGLVEAFVASSLISPPTVMTLPSKTGTTFETKQKTKKGSMRTIQSTTNPSENELLDTSNISDPGMRTGGTNISNTSIHTTTTATLSTGGSNPLTDNEGNDDSLSAYSMKSDSSTSLSSTSSNDNYSNQHNIRRNTNSMDVNMLGAATAKAIALAGSNDNSTDTLKSTIHYHNKENNNTSKVPSTNTTNISTSSLPVLQTINHNTMQPQDTKQKKEEKNELSSSSSSSMDITTTTTTNDNSITKENITTDNNETTTSTTVNSSQSNTLVSSIDTGSNDYWSNYDTNVITMYKEKETDEELTPRHGYMAYQNDINDRMRAILIDWLIDVHYKYRLHTETLFLAINIVDRFLSRRCVPRTRLQLVGVTAMWLACKRQEIWVPELRDFVYITDSAYTTDDILFCETEILRVLKFRLEVPTVYIFATHLLHHLKIEETNQIWFLTMYFLERSLQEYHFLRYFPSRIAAAAVALAMYNIQGEDKDEDKYIKSIYYYTNYNITDLQDIQMDFQFVMTVVRKDALSHSVPLVAVDRKYALSKYGQVSELPIKGPAKI